MPRDTTPAAAAVQLAAWRRMSGAERLALAVEMSEFARALARAGLRRRHPDWTEDHLRRELLRRAFLPGDVPAPLR